MTTISGTSSSTSSATSSSATSAAATAEAAAQAALKSAAESIIGSATGDSSLDVSSLVSALVTAQVAGQTAQLTAETDSDNTQISAFGQLSAALSGLQVAVAPLYNGSMLTSFSATLSGTGITASASSGAVPGTYSIDATQLASAQTLTSSVFSTTDAASLGTGTLTISVGSSSMTLDVDSSNDSLSELASAINSSSDNPGLTASVITGASGQYLTLSANSTGASNTINISASSSSSTALQSLAVTTTAASDTTAGSTSSISPTTTWTQTSPALDAELTVNGISATSSTNSVTGVIDGVTLNLTSAGLDTSGDGSDAQTLTVAADTSTEVTDISNFVTAYNAVISTIGTLTEFDSTATAGSQGGPLLGNSLVEDIQNALGNIVGSSVSSSGVTGTLAGLGITLESDGTLSLDTTTLTSAVADDPSQVEAVFNLTNGIGQQLNAAITPYTESDGLIDSNITSLTSDLQSVTTQTNTLTAYSNQLTSQYEAEFTSLDTIMASTNSDSEYLTALFGGSSSSGTLSSSSS